MMEIEEQDAATVILSFPDFSSRCVDVLYPASTAPFSSLGYPAIAAECIFDANLYTYVSSVMGAIM